VRNACDLFRDVWKATDGVDGRVSIEVDPRLAHDTERTVAEALDLWKTVDRPNLYVKIPATKAGLPAITRTLAEGVSVNVTLIFSVQRYREVMQAYLDGLNQARANGHAISALTSVASFFVSRMDTEVDKRLEAIGTEQALALRGKAAIANARLAYAAFQEVFTDEWSADVADEGGRAQRPLWASTGTKNPDYSDVLYVEELVVADTVNTMPEKTLLAWAEHGEVRGDTVTGRAAEAQQVFDELTAVGIDIDDVYEVLEREGVDKFEKSWAELLETVQGQLDLAGQQKEG
jgi:transaldolase